MDGCGLRHWTTILSAAPHQRYPGREIGFRTAGAPPTMVRSQAKKAGDLPVACNVAFAREKTLLDATDCGYRPSGACRDIQMTSAATPQPQVHFTESLP